MFASRNHKKKLGSENILRCINFVCFALQYIQIFKLYSNSRQLRET